MRSYATATPDEQTHLLLTAEGDEADAMIMYCDEAFKIRSGFSIVKQMTSTIDCYVTPENEHYYVRY